VRPSLPKPPGVMLMFDNAISNAQPQETVAAAPAAASSPGPPTFSLDSSKLSDMEKKKQEMIMKQLKRREAQELKVDFRIRRLTFYE
jgi:hypothetical protein